MSAEKMGQTADLTIAGSAPSGAGTTTRERNFCIALACAAVLHASAFIGVLGHKAKELGDPTGDEKAISVSLVTEADLKSRSTVAEPPDAPPAPPPKPAAPPQQQPPTPPQPEAKQPPPEPQPEPLKPTEAEQPDTPPPPEPDVAKPDEQQVAKQEQSDGKTDNVQDLLSLPDEDPDKLQSETNPKPKQQPETKQQPSKSATKKSTSSKTATSKPPAKPRQKRMANLDLSTPNSAEPSFNSGHAAAFQRPPGITKSGLNDAFARAVIRALQQTMPQLTGTLGQVTVRIFLSETGNVISVDLLAGAKDPSLNQDVVFAAKQTSYPIPPVGSNKADRTFMVTYIYD